MFIYLTKLGAEALKNPKKGTENENLKLQTENSGESFVREFADPFSPTFTMPNIPEGYIDRLTVQDYIIYNQRSFRTEGIYRHNGAELRCVHDVHFTDGSFEDSITPRMVIDVSAPTLKALREIYSKFRLGTLLPEENWEAPQQIKHPTKTKTDQ